MEESVVLDLGATAGGVVDVVALHGDQVGVTIEVDAPVVVAIAGGGVVGDTVNVVVGERDAVVGAGSKDVVLATDAGGLSYVNSMLLKYNVELNKMKTYSNMVDPDQVAVIKSNSITTPDVLRVDVGNRDVPDFVREQIPNDTEHNLLDDDVLSTADNTETLALDCTRGALTDEGLVGGDGDTEDTSVVAIQVRYKIETGDNPQGHTIQR